MTLADGALHRAILDAHAVGDRAALVTLYRHAAGRVAPEAEAFFVTQAYVFALESGDAQAAALRARLVTLGAEIPG